jgi:molybdopterin synthase catalytic subunit
MTIRVKLFAVVRERAGTSDMTLDLPSGAKVSDARESLSAMIPSIRDLLTRTAFAINQDYATLSNALRDGDELAVIPPVSGG